jgi:hypothetical protein
LLGNNHPGVGVAGAGVECSLNGDHCLIKHRGDSS